jgi:ParB family transcriptional regulator, chromosome partitioning protein
MAPTRTAPTATVSLRKKGSRVVGRIGVVLADRASDAIFGLSGALPKLVELDVAAVRPNQNQPRRHLDDKKLDELASSIEQHGLLQPIVVKVEEDGGYELVAGQRRLEALRRLGRERIPALVTTGRGDELALVENLQRADLDPLDEAEALHALKQRYGYTQDQLAKVMAKAKSTISELLSLILLPEAIKTEARMAEQPPSKSLLIEIARIEGEEAQLTFWRNLKKRPASTVRAARAEKGRGQERQEAPPDRYAAVQAAADRLLRHLEAEDAQSLAADNGLRTVLQVLHARLDSLLNPDSPDRLPFGQPREPISDG